MKRVRYPIEQLKDYLKEEGISKLTHLMKRNYIERVMLSKDELGSGPHNLRLILSQNGTIGVERIELVPLTDDEMRARNGQGLFAPNAGFGDYREIRVTDDFNSLDYVDSLDSVNSILFFSKEIKQKIKELLDTEQSLLNSIEEIKSLKTSSEGKVLILERLTPSRNI